MSKYIVAALTSSDMIEFAVKAALDNERFDVFPYCVQAPDNIEIAFPEVHKFLGSIKSADVIIFHEHVIYSNIFALAREVKLRQPKAIFILLAQVVEPAKIGKAMNNHFTGLLAMTDNPLKNLNDFTVRALHGKLVLSDSVQEAHALYLHYRRILGDLPDRELEVLTHMLSNHTNAEIAHQLDINHNNVHQIQLRLRRSFGVESNTELLRYIRSLWNDLPSDSF